VLGQQEQLLYLTHVIHLQDLRVQYSKQCQRKLVEETPSKFKKAVEECIHLIRRDHFCKESEVPVSGKDFDVHANLLKVLIHFRQVAFHELCNQSAMLDVTG